MTIKNFIEDLKIQKDVLIKRCYVKGCSKFQFVFSVFKTATSFGWCVE